MDLRQLRSLVALAEEQHFTRAAAREHIAQPALSQQIRRLEEELGVTLVHRTTRRVTLSQAGEVLVHRARRALAELQAAEAELGELTGLRTGRVTIGAMQTLGSLDLALLLASFHERHPGVELAVREEPSDVLASMVRDDELDLAFLSVTDRIERHGIQLQRLLTEDLVAVVPAAHPLAPRGRVRLVELCDEPFISFREGGALRDLLLAAAREAGFDPRIAFESNEFPRVRSLVSRGMGVAMLPRSGVGDPAVEGLAVLDLVEPTPTRDVTLAWRTDRRHAPAARAFLDLARQAGPEELSSPAPPPA